MYTRRMAAMMYRMKEFFEQYGKNFCYKRIEQWLHRGWITTPEAHTLRAYVDSCGGNENAREVET